MKNLIASAFVFFGVLTSCADESDPCGLELAQQEFEYSPELKVCADNGDTEAQAWLGMMYWSQADLPDDYTLVEMGLPTDISSELLNAMGRHLITESANQGNATAQNELGASYMYGYNNTTIDYGLARVWLERATEAGDFLAASGLAKIYADGLGVEPDPDTAFLYLELSAQLGWRPARCAIDGWKLRQSLSTEPVDKMPFASEPDRFDCSGNIRPETHEDKLWDKLFDDD